MRSLWLLPLALMGCKPDYSLGGGPGAYDAFDDLDIPDQDGGFDLDGDGQIDGDHYDLTGGTPADVVIYGDTSGSMTEELVTLGDHVLRFTDRLAAAGADWHLMAITGADGCGVDGIFGPNSPDFEERFSAAILTPPVQTDYDEMGLQNVRNAISQADGGCNAGFLRANAILHVIFITDENDESPGFEEPGYWTEYVDLIVQMKGNAALTRFSAVAGPTPDGCTGADPGFGYDEVVDATNGEFISICDDWPARLDTLADLSVVTEVFPLSVVPVEASIEPYVNGEPREDGWTYEPIDNAVRFTWDAPRTGDVVDIFYEAL